MRLWQTLWSMGRAGKPGSGRGWKRPHLPYLKRRQTKGRADTALFVRVSFLDARIFFPPVFRIGLALETARLLFLKVYNGGMF